MMTALQHLSPHLQQELGPLLQRWAPFVHKVTTRVNEVIGEADQGLDQLIDAHATDFGPMGAAFGALQARFKGIEGKVGTAADQIEKQVWEMLFRADLPPHDSQVLGHIHTLITREEQQLRDQVNMRYEELHMKKSADWARRLGALAEQERAEPPSCTECGSPFQVRVFWQSSNEPCPHCNALNALTPGMATATYYGQGAHALSHEAAWAAWQGEQQATAAYNRLRHPTAYDHWHWLQAVRNYWTTYYQHYQQMHPGFAEAHGSIEQAVEAKLKHYVAYDPPVEAQKRDFMGHMMNAACQGNLPQVQQMVPHLPQGIDLEDCATAAFERNDIAAATLLLNLRYDMEGEDEPRDAWIQEQLRDMHRLLHE